jgi:hypothetical protein
MVDALRITGHLGADNARRVGLKFRATHATNASAAKHLNVERTRGRTVVRTGGVANLDLGMLIHTQIGSTKMTTGREHLSAIAHTIPLSQEGMT